MHFKGFHAQKSVCFRGCGNLNLIEANATRKTKKGFHARQQNASRVLAIV